MRCPVCQAENDQGPNCRRCRADLSLLFDLEAQHAHLLNEAQRAAARGHWSEAMTLATQADDQCRDLEAQRLLTIGHLLNRDFERAWECYQRVKQAEE